MFYANYNFSFKPNLLKFMPNISTLARIFTKVTATLENTDSKLTALLEYVTVLLE